jgi:hypothetical protein
MNDNGEELLDELSKFLHRKTLDLAEAYPDDIEDVLLVIHRVTIVLVEIQERMMLDCGLDQDDLNRNRTILEEAKEIAADHIELKINMPGGDA